MAVLPMLRVTICALKKYRKPILEYLQRQGVMEIHDDISEDSVFHKSNVSAAELSLNKQASAAKEALHILDSYDPQKASTFRMLEGRAVTTANQYDEFSLQHDDILDKANQICNAAKQIAEWQVKIQKLQTQREILTPWFKLDVPMNFSGTTHTSCFIGTLPDVWSAESIEECLAEQMPAQINIISESPEQTCIFLICLKEKTDEVFDALRTMGFSYAPSFADKPPAEQCLEVENQIQKAKHEIQQLEDKIRSYGDERAKLKFLADYDTMRADKYEIIGRLLQSRHTFVMTGFIPEKACSSTESYLAEHFETVVEFEQPAENEEVPVLLSNNAFSRPLEGVVESYSLPGKGETDPTTVMSLFYYLLFGLMLSDAGYGLIIALACGFLLLKFKNKLESSLHNALSMFFYCGVFTVFWGVLFGSYFGDIVDIVSSTFFKETVSIPPLWFFPVNEPMRMLVFSMLIGIIHLYTGLGMKLFQCIKQKDWKSIAYDVLFWYVLLTGCVLKLLSMKMVTDIFSLNFVLPESVGNIAGICAIAGAVGIALTNGRESRNPFKRFLKGLYALYGITGYLSDVLSYSRLLALGLATGVICTVVNKMAAMLGGLPGGIIWFTLVCLIGHAFNLSINALGAYVHTNRLQYVEFFGKFYEGGGQRFNPFHVNTKYYKFKEEI